MAMGEARTGHETRQIEMVALDDLVPPDDLYRRVEPYLSCAAIRASAAPFYGDGGRPSVCPAVLVKLFLVAALEGLASMRATLARAERDLAIRRFLGYGLGERLPHHATVSFAQCVRFADSSVFEQLFTQVLARCREAGLLDGTRLVVDATHVEADAALTSLRADLRAVEAAEAADAEPQSGTGVASSPGQAPSLEPPPLSLAAPRSGPTPKRQASNQTAISVTDPDARLRHKPGQRPHLVHRAQVATDPKARVIVAVGAEAATGHEAGSLQAIRERARWGGNVATELCADQGYAARAVYAELEADGVTAFIPPQPSMRHTALGQAARQRCKTSAGVAATVDRMTHGEGAIAELKLRHALGRARCRGTPKLQVQLLVGATAVNLKRLAGRLGADGAALAAGAESPRTSTRAHGDDVGTYEICLN
ncbi:MAG: transposase [Actinomycetota bacterium]|nr:transposase [Actinomycetota bacterium]